MMKKQGGSLFARKMAAGKKRAENFQWQIEVANDEEWDELLQLKGLIGNHNVYRSFASYLYFQTIQILKKIINQIITMVVSVNYLNVLLSLTNVLLLLTIRMHNQV